MNHNITKKQMVGLFGFFLVCVIPLICIFYFNKDEFYPTTKEYLEKELVPGINDYTYVAIDNKKLATIYYTEYLNLLNTNPMDAYEKLDQKSREKSFKSYEEFLSYINSVSFSYKIRRIVDVEREDLIIFTIYDENSKVLTITSSAIMDYVVSIQ